MNKSDDDLKILEAEPPADQRSSGVARVFAIMLVVHVVIIGGIFLFHFQSAKPRQSTRSVAPVPTSSQWAASKVPAVIKSVPPTVEVLRAETASSPFSVLPTVDDSPPPPLPQAEASPAQGHGRRAARKRAYDGGEIILSVSITRSGPGNEVNDVHSELVQPAAGSQ